MLAVDRVQLLADGGPDDRPEHGSSEYRMIEILISRCSQCPTCLDAEGKCAREGKQVHCSERGDTNHMMRAVTPTEASAARTPTKPRGDTARGAALLAAPPEPAVVELATLPFVVDSTSFQQ